MTSISEENLPRVQNIDELPAAFEQKMKVYVPVQPILNNRYALERTLGRGQSCKVKLGRHLQTGKTYAIKIFFTDEHNEMAETEIEALSNLIHPNILRIYEADQGSIIDSAKHKNQVVNYIVLEFLAQGELFDLVCLGGRLSEPIARFFFKQLLSALTYMHGRGVTHRDLKPENLLLDDESNLKVADFGLSAPISGNDGSGWLKTQCGTMTYMAPELHLKKSYTGEGVDLFASAVILFTMVSQRPPFEQATIQDPLYKYLAADRASIFWSFHAQGEPNQEDIYSPEFKDLFEGMTTFSRRRRLTMQQVLAHPWLAGPVVDKAEIKADFTRRKTLIDLEAKAEREQKLEQRRLKQIASQQKQKSAQSVILRCQPSDQEDDVLGEEPLLRSLVIPEYGQYRLKFTQFFTRADPVSLFQEICRLVKVGDKVPQLSNSTLKVKFPVRLLPPDITDREPQSQQQPHDYTCCVRLMHLTDAKHCCDFTYAVGSSGGVTVNNSEVQAHFLYVRDLLRDFVDCTYESD